jgi:hypothetical protein
VSRVVLPKPAGADKTVSGVRDAAPRRSASRRRGTAPGRRIGRRYLLLRSGPTTRRFSRLTRQSSPACRVCHGAARTRHTPTNEAFTLYVEGPPRPPAVAKRRDDRQRAPANTNRLPIPGCVINGNPGEIQWGLCGRQVGLGTSDAWSCMRHPRCPRTCGGLSACGTYGPGSGRTACRLAGTLARSCWSPAGSASWRVLQVR